MSVCIYVYIKKDFGFSMSKRLLCLTPHKERRAGQNIFPAGHQTYQEDTFKTFPEYP